MPLVDGDRGDHQPALDEHARGRPRPAARAPGSQPDRGEHRVLGVDQHVAGDRGQRRPAVAVAGRARRRPGRGARSTGDGRGAGQPPSGAVSTRTSSSRRPPGRGERLVGRLGAGQRHLRPGPQPAVGVPAGDGARRRPSAVVRRVADDQHGVGPAGEAAAGAQQPVAVGLLLEPPPAARGEPLEGRRRRRDGSVRMRRGAMRGDPRRGAGAASPAAPVRGRAGAGILSARNCRLTRRLSGSLPARPREGTTVTYVITQACVDVLDKACIDECPVDCIYEGDRMLYIHPDECVDCGACEPVCPVEAIYYEDDVPDKWKDYYNANVEFFSDLGSPGGAAKTGKIGKDHPLVAALPPQAEGSLTAAVPGGGPARPGCPTSPGTPSPRPAPAPREHPDGVVDLSIGTPVDDTPAVLSRGAGRGGQRAGLPDRAGHAGAADGGRRLAAPPPRRARSPIRSGADPSVHPDGRLQGTRRAAADAARAAGRRHGASSPRSPTRPTRSARCWPASPCRRTDTPAGRRRRRRAGLAELARATRTAGCCPTTSCARGWRGAGRTACPVVADECYVTLGWDVEPRSLLHPSIAGDGPHRPARRALAVQAVRRPPGTAPGCSPATRRSCGGSGRSGGTSACWCPGRCRRRWRRPWTTTRTSTPSGSATAPAATGWLAAVRAAGRADRPLRGRALPLGHPRRGLLDDDRLAGRAGHRGRAGHLLRAGRRAARPPGAHRDRRADRRGRRAAGRLSRAAA